MSTQIDQGIPDESMDWTEIHAFMVALDKQEKNDDTIKGACKKIIYDIMTRTEKSTSLSTRNITSPFDEGPCVKSSSSPVDKMAMRSATATDRPRRHDDDAYIQEQPTSHRRNKQKLAPIASCPHFAMSSLHESARPESSFGRARSTGRIRSTGSLHESKARSNSSFVRTRRVSEGGPRVSWRNKHSVLMFDADESPTTNAARRNVKTTTEPLIFPPLPFADVHCDDIRGTRGRRGSSISTLTSASRSSSLGRIPISPRESLILPGYSLGQSPENRQHMNIPTTRDAGAEHASTLRPLDVAFVLRSSGNWVYGIVCDIIGPNGRSVNKVGPPPCHQPSIRFAVDSHGSTKTIQKKNWGCKIRLINEDHAQRVCATAVA
jgi:hypothetical protein